MKSPPPWKLKTSNGAGDDVIAGIVDANGKVVVQLKSIDSQEEWDNLEYIVWCVSVAERHTDMYGEDK